MKNISIDGVLVTYIWAMLFLYVIVVVLREDPLNIWKTN